MEYSSHTGDNNGENDVSANIPMLEGTGWKALLYNMLHNTCQYLWINYRYHTFC
jgi:hypothetical protein